VRQRGGGGGGGRETERDRDEDREKDIECESLREGEECVCERLIERYRERKSERGREVCL
jgi:hypothetical protein